MSRVAPCVFAISVSSSCTDPATLRGLSQRELLCHPRTKDKTLFGLAQHGKTKGILTPQTGVLALRMGLPRPGLEGITPYPLANMRT